MRENITEELQKAREEYNRLKGQLAEAQYEANKAGMEYSSLFETLAPFKRQLFAIKKGTLQVSKREKGGKEYLIGDRNIEVPSYESKNEGVSYKGHSINLKHAVPLSSLGSKSIGVVVCINDDDLVETVVESLKNIPFVFNLYILCSDTMNQGKMMDMCSEIEYVRHVEALAVSGDGLGYCQALEIYKAEIIRQTFLLVMDMTDKSSALRSMINDLVADTDHVQKVLALLDSKSVSLYIASAAARIINDNGMAVNYPKSAFYWLNVNAISGEYDSVFADSGDSVGARLLYAIHDAGNRVAIGNFNRQEIKLDIYDSDFSEVKEGSAELFSGIIKAKSNIIVEASSLIRVDADAEAELQSDLIKLCNNAAKNQAKVYIVNDLACSEDECRGYLDSALSGVGFELLADGDVYGKGEEYPIYAFLTNHRDSRWAYFGGINCVNEKKDTAQYLREDSSFITYIPVPTAEVVLMTDFDEGYSVLLANRSDAKDILRDIYMLMINEDKELDRFVSVAALEKLYEDKYAGNGSKACVLLEDRINELPPYEIAENSVEYNYWYRETMPKPEDLQTQRDTTFDISPKFSIVIPVYRTQEYYLRRLLDSIRNQTYASFEVCVADASDYSTYKVDTEPRQILEEYAAMDSRFKYKVLEKNGGISANTNEAIEMTSGEYIVFADHDDELTPDALFECAKEINEYPMAQLIYSDEDKVDKTSEEFSYPHFKSDYNPEMLRCFNYICHLMVIKRTLMEAVAVVKDGIKLYERPEFDGSQDYDLILRCCEKAEEMDEDFKISYHDRYMQELGSGMFTSFAIRHIPKVLYHWRVYELSTSGGEEDVKPYTVIAGKKALAEHCTRVGIKNTGITDGISAGIYRINYEVDSPLVSVIIPNKDHTGDLDKAIRSIWNGSYKNVEFIVVENNSTSDETWSYYERIQKEIPAVKVVYYKGDFNYSAINNFGVRNSSGEYLLFLNNDTEMYGTESLAEMMALVQQDKIGIVGARLLYDDNSLQHAGIVVGIGGIAGNIFASEVSERTYFSYAMFQRDFSAATAAVLVSSRKVYDMVGGFTEELAVAFNDVDFCLKARTLGFRVAYSPYAVFHHYESKSRGKDEAPEKLTRFHSEIVKFGERWKEMLIKGDPYYNRNLTLIEPDYSLKMLGRETIGKPCYNELLMDVVLTTEKQ